MEEVAVQSWRLVDGPAVFDERALHTKVGFTVRVAGDQITQPVQVQVDSVCDRGRGDWDFTGLIVRPGLELQAVGGCYNVSERIGEMSVANG